MQPDAPQWAAYWRGYEWGGDVNPFRARSWREAWERGKQDFERDVADGLFPQFTVEAGDTEVGRLASDRRADARRATDEDAG